MKKIRLITGLVVSVFTFSALIFTPSELQAQTASLYATGFSQPNNLTLDAAGNLYVATYGENSVVKVDPSGTKVATYTGFNDPFGLACDGSGNLYVSSEFGGDIKKVDAGTGSITTYATGFTTPTSIAFDANGNLFVANYGASIICKVDPSGAIIATYGAGIANPTSVVIDALGNLYVSSYSANTVTKLDPSGNHIATYTGMTNPYGLALDKAGNLYITQYDSNAIGLIKAGSADGTQPTIIMSGLSFTPTMLVYQNYTLYATDGLNSVYKISGGILAPQTHHFVNLNATGNNDGTSWLNAYTNFQTAIDAASAGDSLLVAQASYQPASGNSFIMKEGVKIFGGFLGTESSFDQRSDANKPTLLGNGNSVIRNENNALTSAALLDGFIITEGGNYFASVAGGGMYNDGASPTISNCIFTANGTFDNGGGMCNYNAAPVITNCIFVSNISHSLGGAIFNANSSPLITNCTFSMNTITGLGGGGIYNIGSNPTIKGCLFSGNGYDFAWGGGMYNDGGSAPFITNCVFTGNKAAAGGGMYNVGSSPTILNCTFSGNYGSNFGDGILNYNAAYPVINNTIIWNNGTTGIVNQNGATPSITYSDLQDGVAAGIGNISIDPLFSAPNPNPAPFVGGDYSLHGASPCINTGTPDTTGLHIGNTDIAGGPRIMGSLIDMGAYESPQGALPVKLISFQGKLQNGIAELSWQTGVEDDLTRFELEKSTSGKNFVRVATITGRGNNSTYVEHVAQMEPISYYRLKLDDDNDKNKFSNVVRLAQTALTHLFVYPNPAKDYININAASTGTIYIYNATGVLVAQKALQVGLNKLDIKALSAGVYVVKVGGTALRFVKQ